MKSNFKSTVAQDIKRIHFVLTYAIDNSIKVCQKINNESNLNKEYKQGFINYLNSLVNLFHSHHTVEDDKIFPYFKESKFSMPYEDLAKQHEELIPLLDKLEDAIKGINNDFDNQLKVNNLRESLENIQSLWAEHYILEEQYLNDENVARLINLEQQAQLCLEFGKYAGQHINPDYLVIPFILFNLPADEREVMAEVFPPVITQELIPNQWKEQWISMSPFFLINN
ncbi:hemerythrin domain-containing protein [Cyanobacterium stanieri LEGE 03274]|uniref:Hemerythrin domain-containing protein n=1 Tax=Cyanobacterium stanieri LEGE 03274 TaxID=1828756 RepID=A0ABR9V497_9CHRO|nr:hemerythrin domain-containing protein [Cyanobacterium stanieri]MBE9222361.1 hemerythrin domain-containing protein [Cyanobacterium stanieri LEGE 03274]